MNDQRKDRIDPEWLPQGNHLKQLRTHNLPTDDVENINSTNKGRDLVLTYKSRIVLWGIEMMPQMIQRNRRVTSFRSTDPKWEQ